MPSPVLDLHMHSTRSDGTLSPANLMRACARAGLGTVALTDHDTAAGVAEAGEAAAAHGLDLVPGVELTTYHLGREVHILGYFIDPEDADFEARLARFRRERETRCRRIVARLGELGLDLSYEDVLERMRPGTVMGRPHIGRAMVAKGHVRDLTEAFDLYLREGGPAYLPKVTARPEEQIAAIRRVGGVSVMAHPALAKNDRILADLADMGLQGVECWTHCHTPEQTDHYLREARRLGLLATGGSDYHGIPGARPLGEVPVPEEVIRGLQEATGR